MTKLDNLIAELSPNGVEYVTIDEVCSDLLICMIIPV